MLVSASLAFVAVGSFISSRQATGAIGDRTVSAQSAPSVTPGPGGNWTKWEKVGCQNWRSISVLQAYEGLNVVQCQQRCLEQLLCAGINFQVGNVCPKGQGIAKGACYLLVGAGASDPNWNYGELSCDFESNECWDVQGRPGDEPGLAPMVLPTPKYRHGCQDEDSFALDTGSKVWSKYECLEKCRTTVGCSFFLHQPGPSSGGTINWCRLMKAGCKATTNTRVDLYSMEAPLEQAEEQAPVGATTTAVEPLDCVQGAATCNTGWTAERIKKCRDLGEYSCPVVSEVEETFNCSGNTDPSCSTWSDGQKVVCKEKGQECQAPQAPPATPTSD